MLKRILTALALCFLTLPALAQGLIIGQPGQGLIIQNGGSSTLTIGTTAISGGALNNCLTVGASNLLGQGSCGGATYTAGTGLTLTGSSFKLGDANLTYSGGALATTSLALGGATLGSNALAVTGSLGLGATSTIDAILTRDAANALALQNGTNAQSLRVYNTWSSSGANYERGVFDWQGTSNVLSIGTQAGGTGVARNLQFLVGGTNMLDYGVTNSGAWTISGNLYWPLNTGSLLGNTVAGILTFSNAVGYSNGTGLPYSGFVFSNNVPLVFTGTTNFTSPDLFLVRDGAGIFAQRNGTNAQSLRVYNTWSSSGANYERGVFDWQGTSNVLSIGTQAGGTGVARNLQFLVGGVNKLDYGITNAGAWTSSVALSATAYSVGATAGVSCAANSITILTFTVTNGIVTHC